ncbi:hypothetical protein ACFQZS_06145 [Mucilaginibacter calamicampi]|uniref:Uncharacterized protein n=1 Tax=Mucilaginibacter calamicampi TaxID=1302352 RepID=A0ABW2YVC9_9SPHI
MTSHQAAPARERPPKQAGYSYKNLITLCPATVELKFETGDPSQDAGSCFALGVFGQLPLSLYRNL